MSKTSETLRGVVHGKSIELEHPLSIPDGSEIEVIVKLATFSNEQRTKQLESLFGSCQPEAEDLDEFLIWSRDQRKHSRPEVDL